MATEEKVVLKVEVDADISNDIAAIRARLKAIEDRMGSFNRKAKDMDRGLDRVNKRFDKLKSVLSGITKTFTKLMTTLAKFSFIALAGQIGLFTAGLLAAKAALVTGRAAVSAYQASLRGLSVAAAGVATAMAVAAAAMRQFNEAQLGSQFGGGPQGRANAIRATRGISSRTSGLLGREATSAIAGSLGRAGVRPSQTNNLVRQLYNISGGDAKAAQSLAASIGSGDLTKARTALRGSVGFNQGSLSNVSSMQGLMGIVGGGGATAANFQSVGADMASTFIGTLKTEFAGLQGVFADLGAPLLEPFRQSFVNISRILKEDILSMTVVIQKFGAESFAPTIESFVSATSDFIRKNIVNNLSDAKKMGESFVNFGKAIKEFFLDIGDFLKQLEPAADVVMDLFRALGNAAGGRGLFQQFNDLVVANAEAFKNFGSAIGNVIGALFDQLSGGQMGFFNKLPLLADIFNTLANDVIPALFEVFSKFLPLMERLPGVLESLANVLEFLAPIIETLVGVVDGLLGGLQNLGGAGDLVTVLGLAALIGSRGKAGKFMRGAAGRRAAAGAAGGRVAATGGNAFTRGFSRARAGGSGYFSSTVRGARGAYYSGVRGGGGNLPGRMSRLGGGKVGLLSAGLLGLDFIGGTSTDNPLGGFQALGDQIYQSPNMMSLSVGSAAGLMPIPGVGLVAGGLTAGVGSNLKMYNQGMSKSGMFGSVAGGAAIGAGLGMMGGPFAPITVAAGALAGAIIGGVAGIATGIFGNNKIKKAAEKAADNIAARVADFQVGSGTDSLNALVSERDMLMRAREAAGFNEDGSVKDNGNTREFSEYLMSIGVDPNSVHRNNMFEQLMDEGTLQEMDSRIEAADMLMTDQMERIASITGMTMDEVARTLNNFNIDPFMDYMEENVAAIIEYGNRTVADLNQTFLPDFFSSEKQRNEMIETNKAQLGGIVAGIQSGDYTTDQVMDFLSTNTQINMANGMSGSQASLAAIQSFGLSLTENLGADQARTVLSSLGLTRNGSVMGDLVERIMGDLGFDEMGLTSDQFLDVLFGAGGTFLQNDLGFNSLLTGMQGGQQMLTSIANGDYANIQALGRTEEFAGLTIGNQGRSLLTDAVYGTDKYQNLQGGDRRLANEALERAGRDGYTVEEVGMIAEQYGLDAGTLSGIMQDLPTDMGERFDAVADRIVQGLVENGRPQVSINGDLNTLERGVATYEITTSITSSGGNSGGPNSGGGQYGK
jgi:hypothetical protein